MNFSNIKDIVIPEGRVRKISSNGITLWQKNTTQINEPLCFTCNDEGTALLSIHDSTTYKANPVVYYALADKDQSYKDVEFTLWDLENITSIMFGNGRKLYIKGENPNGFSRNSAIARFVITGDISTQYVDCTGNIMSLLGTSITEIQSDYCFNYLFSNCELLRKAPELPSTTLTFGCYSHMFENCTMLKEAPVLQAIDLISMCYSNMFIGCTSLRKITCYAQTNINEVSLLYWTDGVSSTGTFVKPASVTYPTGVHGIPSGWTIQNI